MREFRLFFFLNEPVSVWCMRPKIPKSANTTEANDKRVGIRDWHDSCIDVVKNKDVVIFFQNISYLFWLFWWVIFFLFALTSYISQIFGNFLLSGEEIYARM